MTARRTQPTRRLSWSFEVTTPDGLTHTATASFFPDGGLAEIFLRSGKVGSSVETSSHDAAVVCSLALQHGVPLNTIRHALQKLQDGSAAGPLGRALDMIEAGQYA